MFGRLTLMFVIFFMILYKSSFQNSGRNQQVLFIRCVTKIRVGKNGAKIHYKPLGDSKMLSKNKFKSVILDWIGYIIRIYIINNYLF